MIKVYMAMLITDDDDMVIGKNGMDYILNKFSYEYIHPIPIVDEINGHRIRMYGFSTDKKIVKEFLSIRSESIFFMKKVMMENEEYDEFKKEHKNFQLDNISIDKYNFPDNLIISNSYEDDAIHDTFDFPIEDRIEILCSYSYRIFKDRYIQALDNLLYNTFYAIVDEATNENSHEIAIDAYYGYGLAVSGKQLKHVINYEALYAYVFKVFLERGDDNDNL